MTPLTMREDSEDGAVIDCQTILPNAAPFSAEVIEVVVGSVDVRSGNLVRKGEYEKWKEEM